MSDKLKIIDFEKRGNSVRFYLGDYGCDDYWGDDWDDAPYDCNAGTVYEEYIKSYKDITFPFTCTVLEPCEDWHYTNCQYSKEDMKNCKVPCIVVIEEESYCDGKYVDRAYDRCFNAALANSKSKKYYFEDILEE